MATASLVVPIEGGNHWGILTEEVAGPITRDGLKILKEDDNDEGTRIMTLQRLQNGVIDHIATFCFGWD